MNTRSLRTVLLSSAMAITPSLAYAQQTVPQAQAPASSSDQTLSTPDDASTIVVTGTRASLETAERVKRDATVVVDGISADDISALPDASISDSLVRVTGLTANDGPRGPDAVSVRGLSPDFTIVTVNGRILPGVNGGDRRISLASLPTEGISGAFVQKTPDAASFEGAVAGTLDLQTIHPLESRRRGLTLVGRALYQDNSSKLRDLRHYGRPGARAEVTYVGRPADNLGVAVSYSFLKQYTGFNGIQVDNYRLGTGPRADTNADGVADVSPTNVGITSNFNDDKRHSVLGMVQWDVAPDVRISVDGLYVRDLLYLGPTRYFANNIFAGANLGAPTAPTTVRGNSLQAFQGTVALYRQIQNEFRQLDQNYGGGFNISVDKGPILFKFDVSMQEAKRSRFEPQAIIENDGATAMLQRLPFGYDISNLDNVQLNFQPLTAEDYALSQYQEGRGDNRGNIKAIRADFAYRPDNSSFLKSVAVGFKVDRRIQDTRANDTTYTFSGATGTANPNLRPDLDATYLQVPVNPFVNRSEYFGGTSAGSFPYFDVRKLAVFKTFPGVVINNQFNNNLTGTFRVNEETAALYGQLNLETGPLSGNAGLRYVVTGTEVLGQSGTTAANIRNLAVENTYQFLLPSANLRYEVARGLIGRLGYSKTFSRQQFNDLTIGSAVDLANVNSNITITRGNPNLKPFTSQSIDAGVEWFPERSTSISVAGYYKFIKNFLLPFSQSTGVTLPDGTPVLDQNGNQVSARLNTTFNDPNTSNIRGVEVTVRKDLTFLPGFLRNLGVQANWNHNLTTIQTLSTSFPADTAPVSPGGPLSNSFQATTSPDLYSRDVVNSQLFYSSRKLDLRLSYRYFTRYYRAFFGTYQEQPGGQFDLSGGWTFYKKLRLVGSMTNVTKNKIKRYVPDYRDLKNKSITQLSVYQGRVITLGLRTNL